jgi:hypothetical protein
MSEVINVYGPQRVYVGTGNAGAYESLGWTEDGVRFAIRRFYNPVPGDQNGGAGGDPIDEQWLGKIVTGNLVMSRFDDAIWQKVERSLNDAGTNGAVADADIGKLMIQGGNFYKVKFVGETKYVEFPCCLITENSEEGRGSKYTQILWGFKAKRYQGTLYTKAANT